METVETVETVETSNNTTITTINDYYYYITTSTTSTTATPAISTAAPEKSEQITMNGITADTPAQKKVVSVSLKSLRLQLWFQKQADELLDKERCSTVCILQGSSDRITVWHDRKAEACSRSNLLVWDELGEKDVFK